MNKNPLKRASENVIDRRMDTSAQAPHQSDPNYTDMINNSKLAQKDEWHKWSQEAQAHVMKLPPTNPFRQLLAAASNFHPMNTGGQGHVPIPTPRPDPNEPYPTVFRPSDNGKG